MTPSRIQLKVIFILSITSLGLIELASDSQTAFAVIQDKQVQVDEKTIRDLIQQLGDDSFEKREEASKQLAPIGEPAFELLDKAAKDNPDAEIRQRAQNLLQGVGNKDFVLVKAAKAKNVPAKGGAVMRLMLMPGAKKVIVSGKGAPFYWDVATGTESPPVQAAKGNICQSLAITPNGQLVITGCNGGMAHVYDLKAGTFLKGLTGHKGPVRGVALIADGQMALTGGTDQTIRVWNLESGKEIRQFRGVPDGVSCLTVSADGKTAAAGDIGDIPGSAKVRLWDVDRGVEIRSMVGHKQEVTSVTFSPDGKSVVSTSADGSVRLWDAGNGKELKKFGGGLGRVETAAFTPDGKRIVSSGTNLHVWDIQSGQQILQSQQISGGMTGLSILPDGRRCITAGPDGSIRLWEWAK